MSRQRDAHESYAVAAKRLHWVALILVASLVAVVLGMYELSQTWLHIEPTAPVATMPPQPRLQPDPAGDLATERAQQQTRLDRYLWIDRDAGIARIPIRRAMELMVERPATPSGSNRTQEPKQGLPLTPALSPGKSAGGEGAKARGTVGYHAVLEGAQRARALLFAPSPSTASSLGERAGVRGRTLPLLGERRQEQGQKQERALTPTLSPGKSAGAEGAKQGTARMEASR